MQQIAHVLEYYQTKLAWGDAADWPHVHLRERVRHYQLLDAQLENALDEELEDSERAEAEAYERFLRANPAWMKE